MKINFFLKVGFMLLLVVGAVSCKDKEQPQGPTEPAAQTSAESKEYFVNVAQEVINTFKAEDQKDAIALIDQLMWDFDNKTFDWGSI